MNRREPVYERVFTMTDYYDGPRRGIADFEGRPHFYDSEWDDLDDMRAFTFRLSPVEPGIFELAMESWGIWRRWESAFHENRTTLESHPALPEDRARRLELDQLLADCLKIDESNYVRAHGDFRTLNDLDSKGAGWRPLEVLWTRR